MKNVSVFKVSLPLILKYLVPISAYTDVPLVSVDIQVYHHVYYVFNF